jgi:hypothetical protein
MMILIKHMRCLSTAYLKKKRSLFLQPVDP